MCDCSIRMTAVLEYLESAFHLPEGVSLFHCASIMNTAEPIITGCVIMINCYEVWSQCLIVIDQPRSH